MFRRIIVHGLIALLLLPGICAAHCHAEVSSHDPSGLYRPPHFHLPCVLPWLGDKGDHPRQTEGPDSQKPCMEREGTDHDADAFYLPDCIISGWRSDPRVVPADLTLLGEVESCNLSVQSQNAPGLISRHIALAVLIDRSAPLYLLSVSLLI